MFAQGCNDPRSTSDEIEQATDRTNIPARVGENCVSHPLYWQANDLRK